MAKAKIDEKKVNMNILKTNVKALNESGLLSKPIAIKGKKLELAATFIKGLEAINDIGKLDEVPEDIFTFYQEIVPPKETKDATTTTTDAPAAATGRGGKKTTTPPAPPKEKKATRADIFAELVTHKTPYTKEQLVEKMVVKFGGSEPEAAFQIGQMVRTTLALAAKGVFKAEMNDKKQLVVG